MITLLEERPDLRVLVFGEEANIEVLVDEHATATGERIVVTNGAETRELHGLEIWSYGEVPVDIMTGPFFSVIQFRDPKLYFPYKLYLEDTPRPIAL